MLTSRLTSVLGWTYEITGAINPRSLRNWKMQAAGAEMLRIAIVALVGAGIAVAAPVHDAVLIDAPEADIAEHVAITQRIMQDASMVITGGFPVRVDAKIFRNSQRYFDKRGVPMWNRVAPADSDVNRVLNPVTGGHPTVAHVRR